MNNFQEEFYQAMTRLKANSRSRAASTQAAKDDTDARVTEMTYGVLVSRPAGKKDPEVIDLQEYAKSSKAGSVSNVGINNVKAIHNFIISNGRRP